MVLSLSKEQLSRITLSVNRPIDSTFIGNYKTAFKWAWIEFADHKIYEPGDPIKYIDRRVTAKKWVAYLKKFHEERQLTVTFFLNISSSMHWWLTDNTKLMTMITLVSYLAWASAQSHDRISSLLYDQNVHQFLPPRSGKIGLAQITHAFHTLDTDNKKQSDEWNISHAIDHFLQFHHKRWLLIIMSDELLDSTSDERYYALQRLAVRHDVIMISIHDHFEQTGQTTWTRHQQHIELGEAHRYLSLNSRDTKRLAAYRALRADRMSMHQQLLRRLKIDHLACTDQSSLYGELLQFLSRRAQR